MTELAILASCTLGGLSLLHAVFAVYFVEALSHWRQPRVADADLPTVAVLLSLRGADPYLAESLRRLLYQQYPLYEVRIVVDHPDDPAWAVVQQVIRETGATHVHVSTLRERRQTCSLKCSALVQLVEDIGETCQVIVLADGDLMPHTTWLRELVTPLFEEGIGATHGNRWFMPEEGRWGSIVRYLWNAAAVVPMYLYEMPWGGTFAIRTAVLWRTGLVDKWTHAIVDDAPVRNVLQAQGLRVKFVPSLIMINCEECNLAFSLDFITRQLTWGRIYKLSWIPITLHALATAGGLVTAAILVPLGLATGQISITAWAGGGLVCYWLTMLGLLGLIESRVRRVVRARQEPTPRITPWLLVKVVLAIPLAQALHLVAVLRSACKRRITWRGVTYYIRGPWDIRLVSDRPFERSSSAADPHASL